MPSNKKHQSNTVVAAYIGGAFVLLGVVLTGFVTPFGQKVVDRFWEKIVRQQTVEPTRPALAVYTDESLRGEGCGSPKDGKCLACEKQVTFSNQGPGNVVARLACAHMPEGSDIRAVFDGYVITNNPPIDPQGLQQKWNTWVDLALSLTGSEVSRRRNINQLDWTRFHIESISKVPHAKTVEAQLTLETCASGRPIPDSCSIYDGPAIFRIEVVP